MSKTYRKKFATRQRFMRIAFGAFLMVGLFAFLVFGGLASFFTSGNLLGFSLAAPMMGVVATDEEFKKTVLDTVTAAKQKVLDIAPKVDDLVAKFDNLDKSTKKSFEELTLVKNKANEDHLAMTQAVEKVLKQLSLERRAAYGNPVDRITNNEQLRTELNLLVRRAIPTAGCEAAIATLQKALGTTVTPGSTLVPTDALANEIYSTLQSYGVWNTFAVRRVGVVTTRFPVSTARPVMLFVDEAAQIGADATKAGTQVQLVIKKGAVLLLVSRELIRDANFDVTSMVLDDFAQAGAYRLDCMALAADGTADNVNGAYSGIFKAGTAFVAAAGNTKVEKLQLEDFLGTILAVDAQVLQRPCNWWMHNQQLIRTLAVRDGNRRPLFMTALEAPTARGIGSILGFPVIPAAAAPNTNAAGSKVMAFGEAAANVVGIRQDMEFDSSAEFKFDYDQMAYRGILRAGTILRNAGSIAVLTLPNA